MDTIIFSLIFATLTALWAGRPRLGLGLFGVAMLATFGLFYSHLSDRLTLSF